MFDSHCHLNFKAFNDDAHAVANKMAEEKVAGLVVGCDAKSSVYAVDLAQTFPNLWAAVGLHPIHVFDMPWDDMKMKELALEERVVAIGEVGLDFYRFPDDPTHRKHYIEEQYRVFEAAIRLAKSLERPLVVHSRQAYDELIEVLEREYQPTEDENKLHGTVHCFMGNWAQAQRLLKLGFMLGFTGVITYADIDATLLEVVAKVPLNRALIETDAPYLTPEPYRTAGKKETGKLPRNVPQYSQEPAKKIGELQQTDPAEIIRLTEENALRLFQIKDYPYAS